MENQLQNLPAGTALWLVTGPRSCGKTRVGGQLRLLGQFYGERIVIADELGNNALHSLNALLRSGAAPSILVLIAEEAPSWLTQSPDRHLVMKSGDARRVESLAAALWSAPGEYREDVQ
ncbi:hypothetical protein ACFFU8_17945 [Chromobacterium piscinae]|uniref:hypothetical protein n=1 Tax=Chromobacterium piscinae TaxID=686831 RepID=UPI001E52DBA4|nr:hypothetical protein [Chromobacterium piscinae]MCD5326802.1 hypothetical protein [Chromobacterium piscinae]